MAAVSILPTISLSLSLSLYISLSLARSSSLSRSRSISLYPAVSHTDTLSLALSRQRVATTAGMLEQIAHRGGSRDQGGLEPDDPP